MSIIHDALKKVQQGLSKNNEAKVDPPTATQSSSTPLYATPPKVETLPRAEKQKPPGKNKIKSALALICAMAITAVSLMYIYRQFQNDIPQFKRFAKQSFYKLINKKEIPAFKTKAPEDLKPLAQVIIPSTGTISPTTPPPAPLTLNVHGIMSNGTGNVALINDQVYQEGDEVDGAKIIKINLDSITFNINGTEKTIFVKN